MPRPGNTYVNVLFSEMHFKRRKHVMMTPEKKKGQIRQTIEALKEQPMTSMMLSVKTGILRANLTRYLAKLERQGRVTVVYEKKCRITGHAAKYYSSNPAHFKPVSQPELFERERPRA